MKTVILKLKFLLIAGLAIAALSCNAEDGMDGAPGIQGEPGPVGPQGEQGEPGQNSTNDFQYFVSNWFEPDEGSYTINEDRNKVLRLIENLSSTAAIQGRLIVYYDNGTSISNLPSYEVDSNGITRISIEAHVEKSSNNLLISIKSFGRDLTPDEYTWDSDLEIGVRFRYTLIVPNSAGKKPLPDFSKMNYEVVMDYFGLDY